MAKEGWKCKEFKCKEYSEERPSCIGIKDVHSELCHVCRYGTGCKYCTNMNECKKRKEVDNNPIERR